MPDGSEENQRQYEAFLEEEKCRMSKEQRQLNDDTIDPQLRKIFVGGLPQNLEIEEFRSYFAKFGLMDDCVIL